MCPCERQKSSKKNERREGPGLTAVCAHWNNLTACLSLTTMESPSSIQGATFQGISWWEIFNRFQEMPETGSLCKDVRNSLLNPSDPPLPHPGQAIAPQAQPGPPGSLDWVKALIVPQSPQRSEQVEGQASSPGTVTPLLMKFTDPITHHCEPSN